MPKDDPDHWSHQQIAIFKYQAAADEFAADEYQKQAAALPRAVLYRWGIHRPRAKAIHLAALHRSWAARSREVITMLEAKRYGSR